MHNVDVDGDTAVDTAAYFGNQKAIEMFLEN